MSEAPVKKPALPAFFVSHDGRGIFKTTLAIVEAAYMLKRPLMTSSTNGLGQAVAINGMIEGFKQKLSVIGAPLKPNQKIRALWIEDDIIIDPYEAPAIAALILEADKRNWNIVAPYATSLNPNGQQNFTYYHLPTEAEIGRPFSLEEIRVLKPYDEIHGLAGLGFYYGDVMLDYVWYEGNYNGKDRWGLPSYSGIDWNYFLDNKIELRHYPLRIHHEKVIDYDNLAAITYLPPNIHPGLEISAPADATVELLDQGS